MASLRIPTPLRIYTGGTIQVTVQGKTVAEAMEDLVNQHPSLRPHLFNGDGQMRPFVNLFLNEENIRDLHGVDTPLKEDDRLMLVPSIAGG